MDADIESSSFDLILFCHSCLRRLSRLSVADKAPYPRHPRRYPPAAFSLVGSSMIFLINFSELATFEGAINYFPELLLALSA